MSGLNKGIPVRAVVGGLVELLVDEERVFGPHKLDIDWSEYDFYQSFTCSLTDVGTYVVPIGTANVELVVLKTTAPVQVDYTQDAVARIARVKPLVVPKTWFDTASSPSEKTKAFQPGRMLLTGGPITLITIRGIAGVKQLANVVVAVAGYNA